MRHRWWMLVPLAFVLSSVAQAEWFQRQETIMGTQVGVELWADSPAAGEAAMSSVFADMRRIDALMSTYKPDSEVSRVNAEAARRPVKVSAELFKLIETAQQYAKLSQGAFDITYASVGYLYDYRQRRRPSAAQLGQALQAVDYRQLKLNSRERSIAFGRPGMRIDLGGIAKGHAVDRSIELLKAQGITRAMVNAGGDTRVMGDRFGRPWMVGIRHPDDAGRLVLRLPLADAAFSTSGDYERYFDEGGQRYHHIINPRTGDSPRALRSVTLISDTATRTDGLSKTVFILGPEAGIEFINRLSDVDAVVVTAAGRVLYSQGLEAPPPTPER